MKVAVNSISVPAPPPEQRVVLDLSVEEFALLRHLCGWRLGGHNKLRTAVERGLSEAMHALDPYWRDLVEEASGPGSRTQNASDGIHAFFASALSADAHRLTDHDEEET